MEKRSSIEGHDENEKPRKSQIQSPTVGPSHQIPFKDPTKMSSAERMRRLQSICKPGKSPLSSPNITAVAAAGISARREEQQKRRRRVEHLDTAEGKRFACAIGGGINGRLRRWMTEGTRVMVKLRAFSCDQEPNRILQGAIVAFDKHWNMVLRDVDEVYVPPSKLGKIQSMPGAIPPAVRYVLDRSKKTGRSMLARHLKCSMITGSSVIAICSEN